MIDAKTITDVTKNLIGEVEPYGSSEIDRVRKDNLEKLIYVVGRLLYEVETVAYYKHRIEGSMRIMGERADKALNGWWYWIDAYLEEEDDGKS